MKQWTGMLVLLWIGLAQAAYAQKKTQEVIYLKNGSVLRNAQSLRHLDSLIEVQTADGSVFRFEAADLERITREPALFKGRTKGWFIGFDAGVGFGRTYQDFLGNDSRQYNPTLQLHSGYQRAKWAAGLGVGIDVYEAGTFTPLYARGVYMPLSSRVTPVATVDVGYGCYSRWFNNEPGRDQTQRGGLFLNPAVGFAVRSARKTAFLFTIGYRQQGYYESFDEGEVRTERDIAFHRMVVRLGWMF